MSNIEDQMDLASSTQDEAIQNIQGAEAFDVDPQTFKSGKKVYEPQLKALDRPTKATPAVSSWVSQSPEHASTVEPDIDVLSFGEQLTRNLNDFIQGKSDPFEVRQRRIAQDEKSEVEPYNDLRLTKDHVPGESYIHRALKLAKSRIVDQPSTEREIAELNLKYMNEPEKMTARELERIEELNYDREDIESETYGLSAGEVTVAEIAGGSVDFIRGLWENKKIIGTITGGGALTGAGVGSVSPLGPGLGTATGALIGGQVALPWAVAAASYYDGYRQEAGNSFNTLSRLKDEAGNPINIDHNTKKALAQGVGIASGLLSAAVGKVASKTLPFLRGLSRNSYLRDLALNPEKAAVKEALTMT